MLSGAFCRRQFSADYTITMFGFDFRQGQVAWELRTLVGSDHGILFPLCY
jgi:hypothetical protein